jgi:hypothetical protein
MCTELVDRRGKGVGYMANSGHRSGCGDKPAERGRMYGDSDLRVTRVSSAELDACKDRDLQRII